jgi:hypothetical protein
MVLVIDIVSLNSIILYLLVLSVSEEVLSSNTALWFSPDSKKLAYATFDDNRTRVMSVTFYGLPGNPDYQYTHAVNIRYPKVSVREDVKMYEGNG